MIDFDIRDDRFKYWGIVYHILTAVYESFIVEIYEDTLYEMI